MSKYEKALKVMAANQRLINSLKDSVKLNNTPLVFYFKGLGKRGSFNVAEIYSNVPDTEMDAGLGRALVDALNRLSKEIIQQVSSDLQNEIDAARQDAVEEAKEILKGLAEDPVDAKKT